MTHKLSLARISSVANRWSLLAVLLAVLAPFALPSAPRAQSGPKYTVVPVGTFSPDTISWATDVNNANEVIGSYQLDLSASPRGFVYRGGTNVDLGTLGGTSTSPWAINDAGVITGYSFTASGYQRAFDRRGGPGR